MIKINFRPYLRNIESFPLPISDYEIIEKEKIFDCKPAIYLKEDLKKVKGIAFGAPIEDEINVLNKSTYSSGPFIQYKLQNMLILKNRLYFENYKYALNPLEKTIRFYKTKSIKEFESAAFSSMRISTCFFGHWLHEELQLIDYLQGKEKIVSSSDLIGQKLEIKKLFELEFSYVPFAKIKTVEMFHGWQHTQIQKDIFHKYKQKISKLSHVTFPKQIKIVYLARGESGSKSNRIFLNENQLIEQLHKHYDIKRFVAESTPILELYSAIYNADIILGIEGSQMAHAIIAGRPGATLLCIQPPYRFYNPFKTYCEDAKLAYAFIVADLGPNDNMFTVNINKIKNLFDKINLSVAF